MQDQQDKINKMCVTARCIHPGLNSGFCGPIPGHALRFAQGRPTQPDSSANFSGLPPFDPVGRLAALSLSDCVEMPQCGRIRALGGRADSADWCVAQKRKGGFNVGFLKSAPQAATIVVTSETD
ncbi:MAG: hypothetical protein KKE86_02970 [Planctomycetes bacterium]|nr:hypothetical protein [Planctomycetota bacterium]